MNAPILNGKYKVNAVIDLQESQSKVWEVLKDFSECLFMGTHCARVSRNWK